MATTHQRAAHNDSAIGEGDLFPDLEVEIPASRLEGWRDKLAADVPLAEGSFVAESVQRYAPVWLCLCCHYFGYHNMLPPNNPRTLLAWALRLAGDPREAGML